jgi:hypothetical protein
MVVDFILIAFLSLLLFVLLPVWPYSRAWGAQPARAVTLVLAVVAVLAILRSIF